MTHHFAPAGFAVLLLSTTSLWAQTAAIVPTGPKTAIEEVVVTAQLRSQKIQKVPISINAFSSTFIKQTGSQNIADLQKYTPGLTVDDTSTTQPSFSLRGISADDFGVGTDPPVGLYVDGFYSARSGEALVFFDDVARVEVLKGPQGTLFGRNTAAGAISIVTNKPTDAYQASVDYKVGNYGKEEGTVMVNVPVSDTFSVRVDGIVNRRDGYLTNDYDGQKINNENNDSARVAARWTPSADTDVLFAWDYDNTQVTPPTALGIGPYAFNGGNPYGPIYDHVIDGREARRLDDLSLTAHHDFDNFTLTSLSSYKFFSTQNRESETGSPLPDRYFDTENLENNHSFYQEVRANGVWGPLTWVAGASYFQEHAKQQSIATALTDSIDTLLEGAKNPPVFQQPDCQLVYTFGLTQSPICGLLGDPWQESMNNLGRYNATSAFGDLTYAVTPQLNLTVGARFTEDDKKFSWLSPQVIVLGATQAQLAAIRGLIGNIIFPYPGTAPNILPQGTLVTRSNSWDNVSPRFVVDYHWTDDIMTYASVTFGYKAGGFDAVEIDSQFAPEKVRNYEGGLKSEFLQHRLRFNLSIYDYEYDNFQTIALAPVQNSIVPQYLTQSGNLQGRGADVELIWLPVNDLTLSFVSGYIDSTWLKRIQDGLNLAGQPTGEPELRAVFGADYIYSLGRYGALRFHGTHSFTSRQRRNADTTYQEDQAFYNTATGAYESLANVVNYKDLPGYYKSHNLTDARLTWSDVTDHYQVALYAQNLFDHRYVTDVNYITASTLGTPYVRPMAPRFWGAELTYRY